MELFSVGDEMKKNVAFSGCFQSCGIRGELQHKHCMAITTVIIFPLFPMVFLEF